jgi:hypothetical protein
MLSGSCVNQEERKQGVALLKAVLELREGDAKLLLHRSRFCRCCRTCMCMLCMLLILLLEQGHPAKAVLLLLLKAGTNWLRDGCVYDPVVLGGSGWLPGASACLQ